MDFYELTVPIDSLTVLQKDSFFFPATVYAVWLNIYLWLRVMFLACEAQKPLCSQVLSVLIHALYVPHSLIASKPCLIGERSSHPDERGRSLARLHRSLVVLPREVAEALASQPSSPVGTGSQSLARRPLLWLLGVFPPSLSRARNVTDLVRGGGWDFLAR